MKLFQHVANGVFVFFLFITSTLASTAPVFSQKTSDAVFLGVDGSNNLKGANSALSLFLPFQYYASAQMMAGGVTSPSISYSLNPTNIAKDVLATYNRDKLTKNFVFYLAGHGSIDSITTYSDGVNNYGISPSDIRNALSVLPEYMNKIIILDACHSGSFEDDLKDISNVTIFTSSKADKKSYYFDETGITAFSYTIANFFNEQIAKTFFKNFSTDDLKDYLDEYYWNDLYLTAQARRLDNGELEFMTKENFEYGFYQSPSYSTPVPAPASIVLLSAGLAGLAATTRRRK